MPRERSWGDPATVVQIYGAASLIVSTLRGIDRESFLDDMDKQGNVILRIIVIGEATKRLSAQFREKHRHIPWSDIAGMRDNLVHGYDQWDLAEVWKVSHTDVPSLLEQLAPLLPPEGPTK
jgi:uncharacterized protein with HEPN domain